MNTDITQNAQMVADIIQSINIKASYELMCKLVGCIELLNKIVEEGQRLEKENAEFRKALGLDKKEDETPAEETMPIIEGENVSE